MRKSTHEESTHATHHTFTSYALCGAILFCGQQTSTSSPNCRNCQRLLAEYEREDEETGRYLEAEALARALQSTTDRYLTGYMAKSTWDNHMRSLWGQVEHAGLCADVMRLVDPLAQTPARFIR